jgi:signal transduction histidine kinase
MGEMIGNIAHQWRQPLNALGLLLANLKDAFQFGELTADYLDKAVTDGNRLVQKMSMTINDFRDFFHPSKECVPFSALKQIREATALVEPSFRNERVEVQVRAAQDLKFFGYPNEYSQVLLNLLANSKDAIKERKVADGLIEIVLTSAGGGGRVTVRDNGGGIGKESLERIFEPYFSTKQMGTGIGLYMSKMIIERNMHGRLTARNVDGGAEFTIDTPLCGEGEA